MSEKSGRHLITTCPLCGVEPRNGERPFYFNLENGCWNTYCCKQQGNLWQLKTLLRDVPSVRSLVRPSRREPTRTEKAATRPQLSVEQKYEEDLWSEVGASALEYLRSRGLSDEAIRKFRFGYYAANHGGLARQYVAMPYFNVAGDLVNVKFRQYDPVPKPSEKWRRFKGGESVLFGAHLLKEKVSDLVYVCEAELDAASAWQLGLQPVVASSLGAGGLQDQWREDLIQFDQVYLLYDRDDQGAGNDGALKMSEHLGSYRCRKVELPCHDVNDWLRSNPTPEDVQDAVDRAVSYRSVDLLTIHEAACKLQGSKTPDKVARSWPYKALDARLHGLREGEVTVVTGDTSVGKTTLCVDLARRVALGGAPVLYWPAEGGPENLASKVLSQTLGASYREVSLTAPDLLDSAMGKLASLPVYVYPRCCAETEERVSELVRYFARRYGGKLAVFDHVGKVIGTSHRASEDTHVSERWASFLCDLAKETGVHLMLIRHPTKPSVEDSRVSFMPEMAHLKGSSAWYQDPDNVFAVGKERSRSRSNEDTGEHRPATVVVLKARGTGEESQFKLWFHAPSERFFDLDDLPHLRLPEKAKPQERRRNPTTRRRRAGQDAAANDLTDDDLAFTT